MAQRAKSSSTSRIPNFFKLEISERIEALREHNLLADSDLRALRSGKHVLQIPTADHMIENVVGVMGLPLGLGLNFLINGKDVVVPLVVEEPSIVAGLSAAARVARLSGGFHASTTDPILVGQVQVVHLKEPEVARQRLEDAKQEILSLANNLHPKMVARGGGAKDIETFVHELSDGKPPMLVLHLLVDTRDAMGANVVNGMCESIAAAVESITGGSVFLRILSNLTDKALVRASVRIPASNLEMKGYSGKEVLDGIVLASDLASVDPYRATTHNKGIMNGVDAVAIATGNDFRAIEAAAHAYAARSGVYRSLSTWQADGQDLVGRIEMPMKVGTVGGSLEVNPTVRINHRLMGSPNAATLAATMGAVGLAQNYAALRSLATAGIQQNHMTLHARSVASTAKVPLDHFDAVVDGLIEDGEIKVWKAKEILKRIEEPDATRDTDTAISPRSSASGKIILFGEHAAVYGYPALAAPVPLAVEARVVDAEEKTIVIPRWKLEQRIPDVSERPQGLPGMLALLLKQLGLEKRNMTIEAFPNVPRAMGLGGSAAMAVAIIRALSERFDLNLSNEDVNQYAYTCERAAHGNPSGVDNTVATWGVPLEFRRGMNDKPSTFQERHPSRTVPLLVGMCGQESMTAHMVEKVRLGRERHPRFYDRMFEQTAEFTRAGIEAFVEGKLNRLGEYMNMAHGILNALQLSTPDLEEMVHIARFHGASGAKVSGAGGGGCMVAVCPDGPEAPKSALKNAGFKAFSFEIS